MSRIKKLFLPTLFLAICAFWGCAGTTVVVERSCGDGSDNDRDGLTDCRDDDCQYHRACNERVRAAEFTIVGGIVLVCGLVAMGHDQ